MQARHKSMKAFGENLALANEQLKVLNDENGRAHFDEKYELLGEERCATRFASIVMLMLVRIEKRS